jgi:hypothetical protein
MYCTDSRLVIYAVEATCPYNTNNVSLKTNADDRVFGLETEDTTADPIFEYVYLGSDLSDGLFGWVMIGVNVSASSDPSVCISPISVSAMLTSGSVRLCLHLERWRR